MFMVTLNKLSDKSEKECGNDTTQLLNNSATKSNYQQYVIFFKVSQISLYLCLPNTWKINILLMVVVY